MRYSILIPTLNEEKYISVILGCLVGQTFKDFEVIIVDAKSEDKTKDKVLAFSDKLDLTFVESPQRGVSFQRNYAESLSKTDNLIFFDADVFIEPNFMADLNKYLYTHNVDILTAWNIPITDKTLDEVLYWAFNQLYMEPLKGVSPAAVGTFIYAKKTSFEKAGKFDIEINLGEDFELAKRMHDKGFKYALLKKPVVRFSVRRLDKEGRGSFIWKNIRASVQYHTKGAKAMSGKFKHEFGKFK